MRRPRSRLAQARKAAGYTQEALAYEVGVDRSTVARWEAGQTEPQPWLRPKLARVLRLTPVELTDLLSERPRHARPVTIPRPANPGVGRSNRLIGDLRRAMLRGSGPANGDVDMASVAVEAHRHYQRAEYEAAGRLVSLVVSQSGAPPPAANATAHLVAAKLATKLGDHGSALLAADRAVNYARETNRPPMTAVAKYQVACALLAAERVDDAEHVAVTAADELGPVAGHQRPEVWSVVGLLFLLLAVISARRGDGRAAGEHLDRASGLAEQLGHDGNWLWTGFGPTNVQIHELGVLVELGDTRRALHLGSEIDTDCLPAVLRGRRCQVHLELARAAAAQVDDRLSVMHLLEAERVASQGVSHDARVISLLDALLRREKRGATPGLRALGVRVGLISP